MGTYIALSAPHGLYAVVHSRAPYEAELMTTVVAPVLALYVDKDPRGLAPVAIVLGSGQTVWAGDVSIMTEKQIAEIEDVVWEEDARTIKSSITVAPPPPPPPPPPPSSR